MRKVMLIIRREYLTRVRNKTFILLTFLAPVFYAVMILLPVLATQIGKEEREVRVVDESGRLANRLRSNERSKFIPVNQTTEQALEQLRKEKGDYYILYIPRSLDIFDPKGIELISRKNVSATFQAEVDSSISNRITEMKMEALNISTSRIDSLKTKVDITVHKDTPQGLEESSSGATTAASFIGGFLIYIFIFLYGGLVLRGVQEEKHNRVVEIIISSVRPFQLMMGKIIGIALVGLSQFLVWVLLTLLVTSIAGSALEVVGNAAPGMAAGQSAEAQTALHSAGNALNTLNIPLLVGMFMFYFIGGYLLYSSLFAAFAAAVDSQTDIYQFMFPISLPIIFSILMIPAIMDSPDSNLAVWLSMIPFTSPVIMMARLPFDVHWGQILASCGLLIGGFLLTTWFAAKIYRTGILMYGKKITYRELVRWLFYKA
jgi:ABC-2 type transport system permease protein